MSKTKVKTAITRQLKWVMKAESQGCIENVETASGGAPSINIFVLLVQLQPFSFCESYGGWKGAWGTMAPAQACSNLII